MSDLPLLSSSSFLVAAAANWPALWQTLTAAVHPSDIWAPEDWTKPINLKDVRAAQQFAAQQAVGQGRMIAIPFADVLTRETGNALLKLIEEPPTGVSIVLFGETDRMLSTIRSRVQVHVVAGEQLSEQRLIQFYRQLDPLRDPAKTRRFLYYAPLLHTTIQTDTVLDAFSL